MSLPLFLVAILLRIVRTELYLEPKARHATPVLIDHTVAFLLSIVTAREEHALVARRFFVLAHTAWLSKGKFSRI